MHTFVEKEVDFNNNTIKMEDRMTMHAKDGIV